MCIRASPFTQANTATTRMVLQTMHPIEGFIQQGSSDSWRQHVGRYCLDNPLLIAGVCAALAAPLLHLCGVDGLLYTSTVPAVLVKLRRCIRHYRCGASLINCATVGVPRPTV